MNRSPLAGYLSSILLLVAGGALYAGLLLPDDLFPTLRGTVGIVLMLLGLHRFFGSPLDPHTPTDPA